LTALLWVQSTIASFNGDPHAVSLIGQSAGGISVLAHLTSIDAVAANHQPLFHRTMIHSAPAQIKFLTMQQATDFQKTFVRRIGCAHLNDSLEQLSCLEKKSTDEILHAQAILPKPQFPAESLNGIFPWMFVIDEKLIAGSPLQLMREGHFSYGVKQVGWGFNQHDTLDWLRQLGITTKITYSILLRSIFGDNSTLIHNAYPATKNALVLDAATTMSVDWVFTCSIEEAFRALRKRDVDVAKWMFVHSPSSDPRDDVTVSHCANLNLGPCHGEELTFVFGTAYQGALSNATFTPKEAQLSTQMQRYWTSFVNNGFSLFQPSTENQSILNVFNITSDSLVKNYHIEKCEIFYSIGVYSNNFE